VWLVVLWLRIVLNNAAIQLLAKEFTCPRDDSPDDMILGMFFATKGIQPVHLRYMHQVTKTLSLRMIALCWFKNFVLKDNVDYLELTNCCWLILYSIYILREQAENLF
jgi:hypothetical protein